MSYKCIQFAEHSLFFLFFLSFERKLKICKFSWFGMSVTMFAVYLHCLSHPLVSWIGWLFVIFFFFIFISFVRSVFRSCFMPAKCVGNRRCASLSFFVHWLDICMWWQGSGDSIFDLFLVSSRIKRTNFRKIISDWRGQRQRVSSHKRNN